MTNRVVLLLESPGGGPMAVICNSMQAADRIREQSKYEVLGTAPVVTFVEAMLGVTE